MIYCSNCGKGIPDASKFCTFCGTATKTSDHQIQSDASVTNPVITSPSEHHEHKTPIAQPVTPPPQHQQYVPPTETPAQQYVSPAYTTPLQQTPNSNQNVTVAKNEFYKNAGFWGAVLILVGFFLPFETLTEGSLYYLVTEAKESAVYLYVIFPVAAAIIIVQGFTGAFPRFLVVIFKFLPILLLGLLIIGITNSDKYDFSRLDFQTILSYIGIGLYMIIIGSVLILFFKTTKIR